MSEGIRRDECPFPDRIDLAWNPVLPSGGVSPAASSSAALTSVPKWNRYGWKGGKSGIVEPKAVHYRSPMMRLMDRACD